MSSLVVVDSRGGEAGGIVGPPHPLGHYHKAAVARSSVQMKPSRTVAPRAHGSHELVDRPAHEVHLAGHLDRLVGELAVPAAYGDGDRLTHLSVLLEPLGCLGIADSGDTPVLGAYS
jgi:hypothetical protein